MGLGALIYENLGALEAFLFGFRVIGTEDLGAQVATPADQIQRREAMLIQSIDVEMYIVVCPLFNDPLQACRIAIEARFVDRQVAILIFGHKYLLKLLLLLRLLQNPIQNTRLLVREALTAGAHQG